MMKWHETLGANLGLRSGGIALLTLGWSVAVRLHQMAIASSARDATSSMMLLSAIVFICGSAGNALLIVGPGLWETVEVAERWRRLPSSSFNAPTILDQDL